MQRMPKNIAEMLVEKNKLLEKLQKIRTKSASKIDKLDQKRLAKEIAKMQKKIGKKLSESGKKELAAASYFEAGQLFAEAALPEDAKKLFIMAKDESEDRLLKSIIDIEIGKLEAPANA